jgi:DNA replication protein DnaC
MVAPREREATRERIAACCRKLILSRRMVELCEQEGTPKQEEFLAYVLEQELLRREQSKRTRQLNRACFPVLKSLDGYAFSAVRLPPALPRDELLSCRFITEKKNLILYGPVGIGKTHLAIALGVKACGLGVNVRFYTVTQLVLKLGEAHRAGTLEKLVRDLQKLDLLILDEWGYVPVDKEGSQLLFRVVADSYERKSLILTTNLEFSKWGAIFTDEQMAAAMIDRLIHHGHLLLFEGESYRMTHALMRQTTTTT